MLEQLEQPVIELRVRKCKGEPCMKSQSKLKKENFTKHLTVGEWGPIFFVLKLVKFLTMGFWDSLIQAKNLRPFLVL